MAGGREEKPYSLRYHKHIPFTWEVCRLVWRKERRLLGWGSRRAAFGGAARAACLSARSSLVHSRKLCQRSVCGAEWWLLRELIQVKNNFLGMVGGTRAQLRGTAGGTERIREVESSGSCLGCQPPSEEMPRESSACAHVFSSFQLCSRDGHLLLTAVSSYSSSHPGLTTSAELLLELSLAHLGQNELS